jgi:beta-lactamase class A
MALVPDGTVAHADAPAAPGLSAETVTAVAKTINGSLFTALAKQLRDEFLRERITVAKAARSLSPALTVE